jgi:hypothetical protein
MKRIVQRNIRVAPARFESAKSRSQPVPTITNRLIKKSENTSPPAKVVTPPPSPPSPPSPPPSPRHTSTGPVAPPKQSVSPPPPLPPVVNKPGPPIKPSPSLPTNAPRPTPPPPAAITAVRVQKGRIGGKVKKQPSPPIPNNNPLDFQPSLINLTLDPINYKHSGDFGDILYFLPAMKYRPGHLFIAPASFTRQRLTPEVFKTIAPLLESQPYVKSVREYTPDINIVDADFWRKSYDNGSLAEAQLKQLNVPLDMLNEPWLSVSKNKVASCVVNRTARYHENFPIERVTHDAVFIGTPIEYEEYCKEFKKIPYYKTNGLLEAAQVIAGADLYIGNQSSCLAICIGLKQNAAVEVWLPGENCYFKRDNVKYYY